MSEDTKICYIYNPFSSFEVNDLDMLKLHFDTCVTYSLQGVERFKAYAEQLKQQIQDSDVCYSWFAGWHTLIATKLCEKYNKPMVVVAGGFDVAKVKEIKYGAWCNFYERFPSKYTLKHADLILSVSKSNQRELLSKVQPKANKLIYSGADTRNFYPGGWAKQKQVVTVGGLKQSNLERKGLIEFVLTGKECNDVPFKLVGKDSGDGSFEVLEGYQTSNTELLGYKSPIELLTLLQNSAYYAQLSVHEGFGLSVAEAMLCECVPIVTDSFALPEVVGDTGYIVNYKNRSHIKELINHTEPEEIKYMGEQARKRVLENFTLEKREKALVETIEELVHA